MYKRQNLEHVTCFSWKTVKISILNMLLPRAALASSISNYSPRLGQQKPVSSKGLHTAIDPFVRVTSTMNMVTLSILELPRPSLWLLISNQFYFMIYDTYTNVERYTGNAFSTWAKYIERANRGFIKRQPRSKTLISRQLQNSPCFSTLLMLLAWTYLLCICCSCSWRCVCV